MVAGALGPPCNELQTVRAYLDVAGPTRRLTMEDGSCAQAIRDKRSHCCQAPWRTPWRSRLPNLTSSANAASDSAR